MSMFEQLEDRRLMTVSLGTEQGVEFDDYLDAINTVLVRIPTKLTHGGLHEVIQELPKLRNLEA